MLPPSEENVRTIKTLGSFLALLGGIASAQQIPNPMQQQQQRALTPNETGQAMPIFRVTVTKSSWST